jgi:hypothetical protein
VQGFIADNGAPATVTNREGHLTITLEADAASVSTATFSPEETAPFRERGYRLFASPTLHPGQEVVAQLQAPAGNTGALTVTMLVRAYDPADALTPHTGPTIMLEPGDAHTLHWVIPALDNQPIQNVGFTIEGAIGSSLELDSVAWNGAPTVTLGKGTGDGDMWRQAWVDGVDIWEGRWTADFQLSQNQGTGLIAQGTEEWRDYEVAATVRSPLAASAGIAVRIGGMRRYYALVLADGGRVQLIRCVGQPTVLAEAAFAWEIDRDYALVLRVEGERLTGTVDGSMRLEATDAALGGGSAGFIVREGTLVSGPITISPIG